MVFAPSAQRAHPKFLKESLAAADKMALGAHVSLIFFALDKQRVDINVCLLKANT